MSSDATEIYKKLSEPFPKQVLGKVNKGGTSLVYVPVSEVVVRLNNVLGVNGWSSKILDVRRDALNPEWVVATVQVSATINNSLVIREAAGGQKIKMTKDNGGPVDLGDEFKGAISDAFKKATQQFGVGIDLARKEEALNWEEKQEGASAVEDLKNKLADLNEANTESLKTWWKSIELPPISSLSSAQVETVLGWLKENAAS